MNWSTFWSAFGLLFIAELADKTQLAVVAQICKHRRPWPVFAGASAALVCTTGLAVAGGQLLGRIIPDQVLRLVSALAFVAVGLLIVWEASRTEDASHATEACEPGARDQGGGWPGEASRSVWEWGAFGATFGVLWVAEMGDKTQLAVLSLSSNHPAPWAVLAGAAAGLVLVTALGVVGGRLACRIIPQRLLLWASAILFVLIGGLTAVGVF